jgi:hypothetical protein
MLYFVREAKPNAGTQQGLTAQSDSLDAQGCEAAVEGRRKSPR